LFKDHLRKENGGLTVTMNPGYAGRTALPKAFHKIFSHVTMEVPSAEPIMQVMLYSHGFGVASDELSKQFFASLVDFRQKCSPVAHIDLGLRAILAIIRSAGSFLVKGADATDSVFSAIKLNYDSLYEKEDLALY